MHTFKYQIIVPFGQKADPAIPLQFSPDEIQTLANLVPEASWLDVTVKFWFGKSAKEGFIAALSKLKVNVQHLFVPIGDCAHFDNTDLKWVSHKVDGLVKTPVMAVNVTFSQIPGESEKADAHDLACDEGMGKARYRNCIVEWELSLELGGFKYDAQIQRDDIEVLAPCCPKEKPKTAKVTIKMEKSTALALIEPLSVALINDSKKITSSGKGRGGKIIGGDKTAAKFCKFKVKNSPNSATGLSKGDTMCLVCDGSKCPEESGTINVVIDGKSYPVEVEKTKDCENNDDGCTKKYKVIKGKDVGKI